MTDFFDLPIRRIAVDGVRIAARIDGSGPPLLLLHGHPQTHAIWHRVWPELTRHRTCVAADLRGYGDSDKPPASAGHAAHSKRAMAADMAGLMQALGHARFEVLAHDRGARVAHRLALDHAAAVRRMMLLDIAPTLDMYEGTTRAFAQAYFHWFWLIQPAPLPERMIGADPEFYLRTKLSAWTQGESGFFAPEAVAEYLRCFADPAAIAASCEDYRAAASIDLEHDAADEGRLVEAPLLALWGARGLVGRTYDVLATWREKAADVRGRALATGHYLPEEAPEAVADALTAFFRP